MRSLRFFASSLLLTVQAVALDAAWHSAADVPVTAAGYTAGGEVHFALHFTPATGAELTVVRNTAGTFIAGEFSNLAQGQAVTLSFGGNAFEFVADYFGGSGNDLMLVWKESRLFAWGYNYSGQLGTDSTANERQPAAVTDTGVLRGKTVLHVAAGQYHSLALCSDGTVAAWGDNTYGQLGDGTTFESFVPVAVNAESGVSALAGRRVVALAAGQFHSLALCSDGTVAAWGDNVYGALGDNSGSQREVPVPVHTAAGESALAGKVVVAIAAGIAFSAALCSDGTVAVWGDNQYGQLGGDAALQREVPVAVNNGTGSALSGRTPVHLAAGGAHGIVLCSDGAVAAWGDNTFGQLGDNTTVQRELPVLVSTAAGTSALAGRTVLTLAAGDAHTLAHCAGGVIATWGYNGHGELGTSATSNRRVPVLVNAVTGVSALSGKTVSAITAGFDFSAAWCRDGTIAAWGHSNFGQLGSDTLTQRLAPFAVDAATLPDGAMFTSVTASSVSAHALAVVALPAVLRPPREAWRLLHFGTAENAGEAADTFDADGDGLVNFMEFAFGTHPREAASRALPEGRWSDGFVIGFTRPEGVSGITYGAEWSTTMLEGSWTALTDTGAAPQHVFRAPAAPGLFVRLRVTIP